MMDFTEVVPSEIVEIIFNYLTKEELFTCSLVSVKWYSCVNTNSLWLRVNKTLNLNKKKSLEESDSVVSNPVKNYNIICNCTTLGLKCYWWSHYKRYKYVQSNWARGNFSISYPLLNPIYICKDYLIEYEYSSKYLFIHTINGRMKPVYSVRLNLPGRFDTIMLKENVLVLTKSRGLFVVIIAFQKNNNDTSFVNRFRKSFRVNICLKNHVRNTVNTKEGYLGLSENFIIFYEKRRPCTIYLINRASGFLNGEIDLHKIVGKYVGVAPSVFNINNEKIYVGCSVLSSVTDYYLIIYNIKTRNWETSIKLTNEILNIYFSDNFLCAKMTVNENTDISDGCNLRLWSKQTLLETHLFIAKKQPSPILTNDKIIYITQDQILVRGLTSDFQLNVDLPKSVTNVHTLHNVWDKFLIVSTERNIFVWDWIEGRKLYTIYRGENCSVLMVTDTVVICKEEKFLNKKYCVIGFW